MTPTEIRDALKRIAADAGPKAWANVSVGNDMRAGVSACLYPDGITSSSMSVSVHSEGFSEAIEKLELAWAAKRDLQNTQTTRKMALSIIEISTDQGECSDAALRGAGFSQRQIDAMGQTACAEATRLAAGGPFSIVSTVGANAEAA